VQAGNVKSISSKGETIQGDFRSQFKKNTRFDTEVPTFANTDQLSQLLEQHKVEINAKPVTSDRSLLATILLSFGPTLLFIGLLVMLMRRAQPGGLMASLGRSKARRGEDAEQRVTFADVAGIDEAEDELVEIVDFLKHPDKYRRLGAKIPRGVLLSGPPGTGKTLLARAVAGEAGVPFFSISASEFVEVIVGVGASRVRDLFKEAKEAAPAIIFIDELDAIGRARSTGPGISGGHDEREQTLNQILTEMDGFDPAAGVIVMGATNRPEILDPALLRPGRFDRRITVQPPDRNGRRQILEVHTRSVPLAEDVDLDRLASSTPGMVGADLANLVNEAALLAAKRGHDAVHQGDFLDAVEKIVLGTARKVMMSDADRERTAYHESGHAIVGMLTPGADPVRKVSIIPRGMSLGVTLSTPDADRFNYSREELVARIKVALGGRAAELVVYGDVTTGAESDIRQLTVIAKSMVTRWGMSEAVGPVFLDNENPYSPEAPNPAIDDEVRRIVEGAEEETVTLLRANRSRLDALVARLLEKETIDQDEVYEVVGPLADAAATPA
jgi:cell division protease FtsH